VSVLERPGPGAVEAADGFGEQGIVFDGVGKTFQTKDGPTRALDDVSLTIGRGEFVTLIGPSGCGKSTLLKIAADLLDRDEGEVRLFGQTVEAAARSKNIGLVPQSPALLPWRTVLSNIKLPLQVNRREKLDREIPDPVELLKFFGLGEAINKRPAQLSGGMQQRVAIARAFSFEPAVLLMDEPFSALDEFTREMLRTELLRIWERDKKTVLFVTHSVTEAVAVSDRVVVMSARPGRIRAVIDIDLPRPRPEGIETTPEFHELEDRIREELKGGWNHGS